MGKISVGFLKGLWIAGLLVLFLDFAPAPQPAAIPIKITYFTQSGDGAYIKPPNPVNNIGLNASLRTKKVAPLSQSNLHSAKQYLMTGWNKTLKSLSRSKVFFDSRIHPALLLLDLPPPSNQV